MSTPRNPSLITHPISKHALSVLALFMATLPAAQAAETGDRVSTIRVPGISKIIKAARSVDGVIHLIGDGTGAPQYVRSADGGATFSAPIPLVDSASRKPGLIFICWDIAVASDGRVHVALGTNAWQLKLPKEQWGFYYTSLAPGAKTFAPLKNLNKKPSEGFSLAAGANGAVTAFFLAGKIYAMVSRDGGKTFSASTELSSEYDPCKCCTTATTYGQDGKVAMMYREETNNDRDIYLALWDQSRGLKLSRTRISTTPWNLPTCPMTYFSVTPTAAGYVAAWPTKGQIYFARMDKEGAVLPPGEIKTPGTNGMRTGVLALNASDGSTLVSWKNNETLGWQLYDAGGQPQGSAGSAPSPGSGAAGVVLPSGKLLLFP